MASIKKVASYIDDAGREIDALRQRDPEDEVVKALTSLHAALLELAAIVRSDRV